MQKIEPEKITITNRKKMEMSGHATILPESPYVAIICHGSWSNLNSNVIQASCVAMHALGVSTITFNTSRTSSKAPHTQPALNATLTEHKDDLADVIAWTRENPKYNLPLLLVGHSIGATAAALCAAAYPNEVQGLVCVTPVISGDRNEIAHRKRNLQEYTHWVNTGVLLELDDDKNERYTSFEYAIDRRKYDLHAITISPTMPFLLVTGGKDDVTPAEDSEHFYEKLPNSAKTYTQIDEADHGFKAHENELTHTIEKWLHALLKQKNSQD